MQNISHRIICPSFYLNTSHEVAQLIRDGKREVEFRESTDYNMAMFYRIDKESGQVIGLKETKFAYLANSNNTYFLQVGVKEIALVEVNRANAERFKEQYDARDIEAWCDYYDEEGIAEEERDPLIYIVFDGLVATDLRKTRDSKGMRKL